MTKKHGVGQATSCDSDIELLTTEVHQHLLLLKVDLQEFLVEPESLRQWVFIICLRHEFVRVFPDSIKHDALL